MGGGVHEDPTNRNGLNTLRLSRSGSEHEERRTEILSGDFSKFSFRGLARGPGLETKE